tara:strand:+ start:97 stop:267 length:171 start_codon:yes stop_codon:yes gene_type:complete
MNGATAVPSVINIKNPKRKIKIMIGASHHFLRTFKNSQNSAMIDNLFIQYPSFIIN